MKQITLRLPYPNERIRDPSLDDISNALSREDFSDGRIGDIWLVIYDSKNKHFSRELWFYINSSECLVAFYASSDLSDWAVTLGDENLKEEFYAEDDGGADWKLNTSYLVTVTEGIKIAQELLETGNVDTTEGWTTLPADFK